MKYWKIITSLLRVYVGAMTFDDHFNFDIHILMTFYIQFLFLFYSALDNPFLLTLANFHFQL